MRSKALDFLASAGWADAEITPVAGDLSGRSYKRLIRGHETAILMDAGNDANSTAAFVALTGWLRDANLSAPEIYHGDPANGMLLLEDFGQRSVSGMIENTSQIEPVFDHIIDLLLILRKQPSTSLPCPDAKQFCDWTRLADDHYPGARSEALDALREVLEPVLAEFLKIPSTTSLRDFHTENMMWLPDRTGVRQIGLLDYQDAFLTHPIYDLVSLLTDARADIPDALRMRALSRYARLSGDDPDTLSRAFAAFSVSEICASLAFSTALRTCLVERITFRTCPGFIGT